MATSGEKRPADSDLQSSPDDLLTFQPLGAGQEVGRSCHIMKFKGKTIMLDCGIHPGMNGMESLPYTDLIEADKIDLVLITHFHIDHCGAIPWFLEKTTFNGRVIMTQPTMAIFRWLLHDYIKVSNIGADQQLYDERDLEKSRERIESINFHETKDIGGIKVTPYHAGHVLGAAMFMIEIAGVKVLYTGDYSREEDRHLMQAEIPREKPDIVITESTYGIHRHEPREAREARFTGTVSDIVQRGGRCLIPVFSVGRAQELLLILDDFWQQDPELQLFTNMMNARIQEQMKVSHPFEFKHIRELRKLSDFDDSGPSVVLASPGMMQSGASRELFESWCSDRKNGVIIAGYSVEGTLAKQITTQATDKIKTMGGQTVPVNLTIESVSFAAHVDYEQNRDFLRKLAAPNVILVHGEANEMSRFKTNFERFCENDQDYNVKVYNPCNTEVLDFYFRGEKVAKVLGTAFANPRTGTKVSGLLLKNSFNYHIVAPAELGEYKEDLTISTVNQRQKVAFPYSFAFLHHFLLLMHGDAVKIVKTTQSQEPALSVMDKVVVTLHEGEHAVTLEWVATAENDMWADSVLATILHIEDSPATIKISQGHCHAEKKSDDATAADGTDADADADTDALLRSAADVVSDEQFAQLLCEHLHQTFGNCVSNDSTHVLTVTVDAATATVTLPRLEVNSADAKLKNAVRRAAMLYHVTLHPDGK